MAEYVWESNNFFFSHLAWKVYAFASWVKISAADIWNIFPRKQTLIFHGPKSPAFKDIKHEWIKVLSAKIPEYREVI